MYHVYIQYPIFCFLKIQNYLKMISDINSRLLNVTFSSVLGFHFPVLSFLH